MIDMDECELYEIFEAIREANSKGLLNERDEMISRQFVKLTRLLKSKEELVKEKTKIKEYTT